MDSKELAATTTTMTITTMQEVERHLAFSEVLGYRVTVPSIHLSGQAASLQNGNR